MTLAVRNLATQRQLLSAEIDYCRRHASWLRVQASARLTEALRLDREREAFEAQLAGLDAEPIECEMTFIAEAH